MKENQIAILVFVIVYLLLCFHNFKWIQRDYFHPEGRFYPDDGEMDVIHLLLVFVPAINFIFFVAAVAKQWRDTPYQKKPISKFFQPRKPFSADKKGEG